MSDPADTPVPPRRLDASATANSLRFLLKATSDSRTASSQLPINHLKQRLDQPDGNDWLQARLLQAPFAPLLDAGSALLNGTLSLDELRALKDRAKAGFAPQQPLDLRIASIAAYFLAIAAALAQHKVCITSQPPAELRSLLIDLAATVAEPWSSFLSSAAFVDPVPSGPRPAH